MEKDGNLRQFQKVILAQGTVTLAVFALITCAVLLFFRIEIRQQILQRDGILLTEVAQYFHDRNKESEIEYDLLDVALESSELQRVIGVGLYDSNGQNETTIPIDLNYFTINRSQVEQLGSGSPVIKYYPDMSLNYLFSDIDALIDETAYPVTEVLAPVTDTDGHLIAIIQYWLASDNIAIELAHLDDYLILIGLAFIAGGGVLVCLVFIVSRKRLLKMGLLLAKQNDSLKKANADLAMAARTSAIGSISSHLFHGLKNPIAGLKEYLKLSGHDDEVIEITDRMQHLINESLAVIRDENDLQDHTLTMEELIEVVYSRLNVPSNGRVSIEHKGAGEVQTYKVQLLLLVIRNLLENAMEASEDATIRITFEMKKDSLTTIIEDTGPGLPEHIKDKLFYPVQSTKNQGTGIGLAISSVIAKHIPSTLELTRSDSNGTTFTNRIPL